MYLHRLKLFQNLDRFRILICGGDGSIGWVMNEVDQMNMSAQVQFDSGLAPIGSTVRDKCLETLVKNKAYFLKICVSCEISSPLPLLFVVPFSVSVGKLHIGVEE